MGSRCSCLGNTVTEERALTTDRKLLPFKYPSKYRNLDINLSSISSKSSIKSENPVDLFQIILLQCILRGYLERRKAKKTLNTPISQRLTLQKTENKRQASASSRSFSTEFPLNSRNLEEIPANELPTYLSPSIKSFISDLSPLKIPNSKDKNLINKGPVYLENKAIYTGQWNKLKQRHGTGKQVWPDGSFYEGEWLFDNATGSGRIVKSNGDYYEGQWLDDQYNGSGKLLLKNGNIFEGIWENGLRTGKGFELVKNESIYTGEFKNDEKNGSGVIKFENGDRYEGEFEQGNIQGKGRYLWGDGRVYEGEWQMGLMHGTGAFLWPDGRKYEGEYFLGKKNGTGKFCWPDSRVYEGGWKDDKQDGQGVYITSMGIRTGYWKDGKRLND